MTGNDRYMEERDNALGYVADDNFQEQTNKSTPVERYNERFASDLWSFGSGLVRKALDLIPDNQQVSAPVSKNPDAFAWFKDIFGELLGAVPVIGDFVKR